MPTRRALTDLSRRVPARTAVAAALALACMSVPRPSAAPPATDATGRIEGLVQLTAAVGHRAVPSGVYPSRRVNAPAAPASPETGHVVVFIKTPPARPTPEPMRTTIAQKDEAFLPRVVAITTGSTVDFPNFDPYFHNVFSLSRAASFDLGRFARGATRTRKFTAPGLVKVYCHIHSHMSASIMVFDHGYFRIPEADGSFTLDGVPAGTYQISAWHERIGESVRTVKVDPGARARVEFSLPVTDR